MKRLIVISFCLLAYCGANAQHNALTDHYLINSLPLNPAFSGSKEALSATLNYRKQWMGITNAPTTVNMSLHTSDKTGDLGFGLLILNDKVAISNRFGVMTNFAYRLKTNKGRLSFGLAAGMENYRNNWSEINSVTSSDNTFNLGDESFWRPNISAGLYYYDDKLFASLSSPFMLSNQYQSASEGGFSTSNNPKEYNINFIVGYTFSLNEKVEIRPSLMTKYIAASPIQNDFNVEMIYREFLSVGAMFRPKESFVGIIKYELTDQFSLGYSVDFGLNEIAAYNNGSHEISLMFNMINKTKSKSTSVF